ncbi:hypothetical protein KSP40_PGU006256 [Platanthera guangdongensis]|uniref:Uncharacterized protein n=1 Tax=Platanthera guangdongensis TaxID=2320717 RepID=A0ABR2M8A1_9ASPA
MTEIKNPRQKGSVQQYFSPQGAAPPTAAYQLCHLGMPLPLQQGEDNALHLDDKRSKGL